VAKADDMRVYARLISTLSAELRKREKGNERGASRTCYEGGIEVFGLACYRYAEN
jgi:hypothetical protein